VKTKGISNTMVMSADDATRQRDAIKAVKAESVMSSPFITLVSTRFISRDNLFKIRPTGCCSKKDRGAKSRLSTMLL